MPKRIVICADGTWNHANPNPGVELSNAAQISRAVADHSADGLEQEVLYIEGIGVGGIIPYFREGYTGRGIPQKIQEAYSFLCRRYQEGDEIFLFGISRGGFVIRRLCQLIEYMGVSYGFDPEDVRAAYVHFCRHRMDEMTRFRERLMHRAHHPCPIKFVGVWDTVDALGLQLPILRTLTRPRVGRHGSQLGEHVQNAFHALAVDELRSVFRPTLWPDEPNTQRRIEQVWFAGNHADVCGGFGKKGLSDVSLGWMLGRAREYGLSFDEDYVEQTLAPNLHAAPTRWTDWIGHMLPSRRRRILETYPSTEWIHESAVKKVGADELYAPASLVAAIHAPGGPRVVC